jgi:flagellar export protein FliJ
MKRFKFRLDSVLKFERFKKTQAAGELAQAVRCRVNAHEVLTCAREALEDTERHLQVLFKQSSPVAELLMTQSGLVAQREAAQLELTRYEVAVKAEIQARTKVLATQRDCEGLVNLKLKHRTQAQVESDKEEEREMDEFIRSRYQSTTGGAV